MLQVLNQYILQYYYIIINTIIEVPQGRQLHS